MMRPTEHNNRRLTWRYKSLAVFAVVIVAVSALITVADGRVLPSWQDIYGWFGYQQPTLSDGELRVSVLDIGEADCILVQSGDAAALIDAGEKRRSEDIVMALEQSGVHRLQAIVITHTDSDHIGAVADILHTVAVDAVYTPFGALENAPINNAYTDMIDAVRRQQIPLHNTSLGSGFNIGNAELTFLSGRDSLETAGDNASSAICRVAFGKHRFLFMGDADRTAEAQLLRDGTDLRADVLKVAHHGAGDATGTAFAEAVSPTFAVITCGLGNSYGHPHPDTVATLKSVGASVYRTDIHGTVIWESDGETLSVYTNRDSARK